MIQKAAIKPGLSFCLANIGYDVISAFPVTRYAWTAAVFPTAYALSIFGVTLFWSACWESQWCSALERDKRWCARLLLKQSGL